MVYHNMRPHETSDSVLPGSTCLALFFVDHHSIGEEQNEGREDQRGVHDTVESEAIEWSKNDAEFGWCGKNDTFTRQIRMY